MNANVDKYNKPVKDKDLERFWAKVDKTPTCWNWTAGVSGRGYGLFSFHSKNTRAHRFIYHITVRPVPSDRFIDHVCKNKLCVNVEHMVVTTKHGNNLSSNCVSGVNARKTHCKNGHPFIAGYMKTKGFHRICLICQREFDKDWQRKNKAMKKHFKNGSKT